MDELTSELQTRLQAVVVAAQQPASLELLATLAVVLRERLSQVGERLSSWRA